MAGPAADIRTGQGSARPAHRHRVRAVRVLPVPDRRDRDGSRGAAQAGQRHPPAAAVLRIGRGYPMPATPRRDVADLLIPDPAEIRSRPASTTQETIVNTDIHRSRSGLGHRVGATERRPRRVRCSGPQQRAAARHRLQILHAAPYATPPPPTSGGNAPTRSSPTPTPSPSSRTRGADLHGHHGGTASAVAARRARSGRAARGRNGRCRPLRGTSSSDRPRRRTAGGQLPGSSASADDVTPPARTGRSRAAATKC